jgi:hypothetical protein
MNSPRRSTLRRVDGKPADVLPEHVEVIAVLERVGLHAESLPAG